MTNSSSRAQSAQNTPTTHPNQLLIKPLASFMMTASRVQFELLTDFGDMATNDFDDLRAKAQRLIDCIDSMNKREG